MMKIGVPDPEVGDAQVMGLLLIWIYGFRGHGFRIILGYFTLCTDRQMRLNLGRINGQLNVYCVRRQFLSISGDHLNLKENEFILKFSDTLSQC